MQLYKIYNYNLIIPQNKYAYYDNLFLFNSDISYLRTLLQDNFIRQELGFYTENNTYMPNLKEVYYIDKDCFHIKKNPDITKSTNVLEKYLYKAQHRFFLDALITYDEHDILNLIKQNIIKTRIVLKGYQINTKV